MKLRFSLQDRARAEEEFRLRPFTFVVLVLFIFAMIGAIFWTFGLSDTAEERWRRGTISLCIVVPLGLVVAWVQRREERAAFSRQFRRIAWKAMLCGYAAAAVFVIHLSLSPFAPKLQSVRLVVGLVALFPVPVLAWRFLKTDGRG